MLFQQFVLSHCNAEIRYISLPALVEQDVARLYVAMDDVSEVGVMGRVGNVCDDFNCLLCGDPALRDSVGQASAVNQLRNMKLYGPS